MLIHDLIKGLPIKLARGGTIDIKQVVEDSRAATPGSLFIARGGTKTDGRKYITDAIAKGAVAVLAEGTASVPPSAAALTCDDVPLASSLIAERFFGNPSKSLILIGITGTNGKTTITYLIRQLLNTIGLKCGLIGTVQIDDGATVEPANLTTPPAIELSRLMRSMVDHGCTACVMEASSHALHQKRTAGLGFKIGVFTNLTGDHLDYHKTMEAYLDAKAILFEKLPSDGTAVLNVDDEASQSLSQRTNARVISCSATDSSAKCHAKIGRQTLAHIETTFTGPWGSFDCKLPLIGRHNVANALQALAVCHAMGLSLKQLRDGIASCKAPPGRLEPVTSADHGFAVLVDYAHTDDALENVLRSLRLIVGASSKGGKLRVVFGCGGDRDRTKRPRMARIACRYADDVIITSDNPRTEPPEGIINEVRTGVPAERLASTLCITDRTEAIHAAIERTRPGDILLIAGKGHEDYQIIGTTKRPFDDRKVAAAALVKHSRKVAAA